MKGLGTLLLLMAGGAASGYFIGRAMGKTEKEKEKYGEAGLWLGAGAGLSGAFLINYFGESEHDTVNYILHHKDERVYDGICYEHRLDARINEHVKDGKVFDTVICDRPKPRTMAMNLERKRIRRNTPKYNVQHKVA